MTAYDQYTTGYITMTAIDDCTWLISNRTMAYWLLQIVQQGPAINKIISQQEVWTVTGNIFLFRRSSHYIRILEFFIKKKKKNLYLITEGNYKPCYGMQKLNLLIANCSTSTYYIPFTNCQPWQSFLMNIYL